MKRKGELSGRGLNRVDELTQKNIDTIIRLEEDTRSTATFADKLADKVANFCGSSFFVVLHGIWFGIWIGGNTIFSPKVHFDPYPFQLLTLIVSLEAIFLSAFIMISQNRQAKISERRSHLDLQINLLSEQENTKMIGLLQKIANQVGVECADKVIAALGDDVKPEKLVQQIEKTLEKTNIPAPPPKG
ncbi:MAG: hypothetical protein JWM04_1600 [Verrucomicrobiales bacterium]|jgi:uncharacterized membrane protein|nr:hypothetical protein [Verrucomicrobiales bacterium]